MSCTNFQKLHAIFCNEQITKLIKMPIYLQRLSWALDVKGPVIGQRQGIEDPALLEGWPILRAVYMGCIYALLFETVALC